MIDWQHALYKNLRIGKRISNIGKLIVYCIINITFLKT